VKGAGLKIVTVVSWLLVAVTVIVCMVLVSVLRATLRIAAFIFRNLFVRFLT
jgi:hypothetical protein